MGMKISFSPPKSTQIKPPHSFTQQDNTDPSSKWLKNIFPTHPSGYATPMQTASPQKTTSPIAFSKAVSYQATFCDGIGDLISIEDEPNLEQAIPLPTTSSKEQEHGSPKPNLSPAPVVDAPSLTSKASPNASVPKPTTSKASPSPSWVVSSTALEKWPTQTSATSEEPPTKSTFTSAKPVLNTTSPLTKPSTASSTSSNKKANGSTLCEYLAYYKISAPHLRNVLI